MKNDPPANTLPRYCRYCPLRFPPRPLPARTRLINTISNTFTAEFARTLERPDRLSRTCSRNPPWGFYRREGPSPRRQSYGRRGT